MGGDWTELSGARRIYDGKFLEGRDGHLFMADDNNNVIAQHRGLLRLSEAQLEGWRTVLERRTQVVAAHGGTHLVMVAPNNHSVYPEKLPEAIEAAPERPVHQLMAHLEECGSPVNIIYPIDDLVAAKPERLVCSQVDSHWTDYGAFLAFMRLAREAEAVVPTRLVDQDDVLFIDITVNGDLGEKLDPPREAIQSFGRMRYRNARLIFDNCVEGTGSLSVTECDPAPPTTTLLLGDSYAYFLVRYLSECWRRLVFAHSPTLDREVVEEVRPDLALTVIAERFLVVVPTTRTQPARCAPRGTQATDRPHPPSAAALGVADADLARARRADAFPAAGRRARPRRRPDRLDGICGAAAGGGDGAEVVGDQR